MTKCPRRSRPRPGEAGAPAVGGDAEELVVRVAAVEAVVALPLAEAALDEHGAARVGRAEAVLVGAQGAADARGGAPAAGGAVVPRGLGIKRGLIRSFQAHSA